MADWHNVRVIAGQHGKNTIVFIDGVPLKGVYHVETISDIGDATRVHISMLCSLNQDLEDETEIDDALTLP